jgi:hypothetical protein
MGREPKSTAPRFADADWLTAERARAWCVILAVFSALALLGWVGLSSGGLDRLGKPLGTDFVSFWTAARLAAGGDAALAYDPAAHLAAQRAAFPAARPDYYAFFYPPPFLLLCLPLALLPYLVALGVWLAAGLAALLACLRRLLPQRWAILPILAFPGLLVNAGHGQNGFLTAGCFGGGMILLERRPLLAGLCLGALVIKPQLAIAVPVALISARRWRAVIGAAISSVGLCTLSWLVLGTGAWRGFLAGAALARETMEQGLVDPAKLQSVFAAVRLVGGDTAIAYALQFPITLVTLVILGAVAARRPGGRAEGALLVAAAMLATPFVLDYDLVGLALPLAWVTLEAQFWGWRSWEKLVLLAVYVLPLVSRPLAMALHLPIAPLVLAALLLVVARRAATGTPVNRPFPRA